jgi:hypothetical protein
MNFDTGECYEKFLSLICFRLDLTSLMATLHVCICLCLHVRFGQYRTNLNSLYSYVMLLHCKRTVHRSLIQFSGELLFCESSRSENARHCGLRT